jgi:hypothetical protein
VLDFSDNFSLALKIGAADQAQGGDRRREGPGGPAQGMRPEFRMHVPGSRILLPMPKAGRRLDGRRLAGMP